MSFAGKVWRLLVGIKDGLSLLFLLLFFGLLYAALTARPNPAQVRDGALLLELDGQVVEEASHVDPIKVLLSGTVPPGEYQARDLVRAIDAASTDDRIKVIVLDLSRFLGGGQVHLQEIGAALDRARAAKKPVLAYATAYIDDGVQLAVHASEVWADPLGGAIVMGPGGNHLYYKNLLDRLKVTAHVYRVGTYKSAVEPYLRNDMSPESRENYQQLYGALFSEWQADVKKARPRANLALVTRDPAGWLAASRGNLAQASLNAGLIDKAGTKVEFGERVKELAGEDPYDDTPGTYAHSTFDTFLADNTPDEPGKAIGVVTIAGEIVDGDAGPGSAGGDRIAKVLDDALDDDLAALVVRVDSPGGSVLASEEIRRAIMRHKATNIPIAVSMANLAASGGYWVSTPATRIFAEPETITGSIGIFAVVPSVEGALNEWGVTGDGVKTTPLSGQPDLLTGISPAADAMLQGNVEAGYTRFLNLVSQSRRRPPEAIDRIAQGRVWDGGTARQIGLVDQYGGLDDALAWAAQAAKLKDGDWHAKFLVDEEDPWGAFLAGFMKKDDDAQTGSQGRDVVAILAARQQAAGQRMVADLDRLMGGHGAQAYCLECPLTAKAPAQPLQVGIMALLAKWLVN